MASPGTDARHRGLAFDLRAVHNAVPAELRRMQHEMRVAHRRGLNHDHRAD
jgi:hypothetical protein